MGMSGYARQNIILTTAACTPPHPEFTFMHKISPVIAYVYPPLFR